MKRTFEFLIDENFKPVQTASFEVPSLSNSICISHNIPEQIASVITLVVVDTQNRVRLQKQFGYSEKILSIGVQSEITTIGGIPGKIETGNWKIILYVPIEYIKRGLNGRKISFEINVSDEHKKITEHVGEQIWVNNNFEYKYYNERKVYREGERWYKGDFHAHTRLSDGKESPERVTEKAEYMNLDFYTATEHNVMHTGWSMTDMLVLPGVEVTTILGHANLFGLKKRPEFLDDILEFNCNIKELPQLWEKVNNWCKDNNVLFSINHPFLYEWKWLYDDMSLKDVSSLEIINDPTYEAVEIAHGKEANELAVKLADLLWADGHRICAVGGSDSHNRIDEFYEGACEPSIAGDPATWLIMKELSANSVYQTLRQCRACVTRYIDDFQIELYADNGKIYPGDKIDSHIRSIKWKIIFESKNHKPQLFYILNGIRYSLLLNEKDNHVYEAEGMISLENIDYNWLRFGATGEENEFMLYTNPITRGEKRSLLNTFGEAKRKLGI